MSDLLRLRPAHVKFQVVALRLRVNASVAAIDWRTMTSGNMKVSTKSTFALYAVRHERYSEGTSIATSLQSHFAANRFRNVTAGARVRVVFRTLPRKGSTPKLVHWDGAGATAVVVLLSKDLVQDPESLSCVKGGLSGGGTDWTHGARDSGRG